MVKNTPANTRDTGDPGLIPGLGRSPGEGSGNPLQYSGLGSPQWTEEPGGLESTGSQRVRHNSSDFARTQRELESIFHNSRVYTPQCSKILCAVAKTRHSQTNQYFLKIQGRNLFGSFLLPPPSPRSTSRQWGTGASLTRRQVETKFLVTSKCPC